MTDLLRRHSTALWSLVVLFVFLAAWQWGPGLLGVPDFVLPHLSKVIDEAVRIWEAERLLWHAGITAFEVVVGFILGSALGALNGEEKWEKTVLELMDAVDAYVPMPERILDKPFLQWGLTLEQLLLQQVKNIFLK